MYNRTLQLPFALNNGSDTAKIPGETHVGFTLGFDALWPHVRTALEAEVAAAGSNISAITLTGHSQGAAVATMLSYAVSSTEACKYMTQRLRAMQPRSGDVHT
jgi:hypothetical protein